MMRTKMPRMPRKRANDQFIVGTYAWAMAQAKSGRNMHRRAWSGTRHYFPGSKLKLTVEDKKAMDWQAYIVTPLAVDQPDAYPVDIVSDSNSNQWFGWCLVILAVAVIVAGALYVNGQLQMPTDWAF